MTTETAPARIPSRCRSTINRRANAIVQQQLPRLVAAMTAKAAASDAAAAGDWDQVARDMEAFTFADWKAGQ